MKTKAILLCVLAFFLVSCGKKEVKPVSVESRTATEAFSLADSVKEAFAKNNLEAIKDRSTEEGFKAITASAKPFDSVSMTFTPRWVEIENNQVMLNISWKSDWVVSGKNLEDNGMAVFVLEGRPLKVAKILRSNPFSPPQQQP
jgi:hypothetical protein